ncbi:MAG TPA: DsbE family thiol:disulfide interchange protein [Usitatibacter sp.]|jgi:cytochrome c biogenesis protein CcmG/thiol:disulfide interchange protein DsbE|nr:DsbE family thiol:disulfide interchange protein [Usitatibacter sp.]
MNARWLKYGIPLVLFAALAAFLAVGLTRDPREVPSPFIGRAAPAFSLERLHEPGQSFSPEQMKGKVWLLNVWASWCVSCRVEHPLLVEMSKRNDVPIVGLDYKDERGAGLQWLTKMGNPYFASAFDVEGKVGIDYGVYGVPETFVIDKQGVIRYKQIGPITPEALEKKILPLIRKLSA